ncbi:hypothetical protein DRH27_02055 [Candidatus Falkowbacteria bacterium]|nr:MAG: hypothetical protein DRH27_02055 [Candidatus Falkowbacteria bacterium]
MPGPGPAGFHIITALESGKPAGLAMRQDPADDTKLLGVELCPDCIWDCQPVIQPSCGSGTCNGLNRPSFITLVVTGAWSRTDDCRGCTGGTVTTCGEQFAPPGGSYCQCDCVPPGTYVLPYAGAGGFPGFDCIYAFDIDYPTYPNPCNNETPLQFRVYLSGDMNRIRVTIGAGSPAQDRTTWITTLPEKDCLDFDISFVSSDQDGFGTTAQSCNTGTVRIYT